MSTQVLQELCINIRRRSARPLAVASTRALVADHLTWNVVVNDGESILAALEIEERYGISFWDALVVQAAEAAGADILYSEDLSHGQRYGSVQVIDPLRDA